MTHWLKALVAFPEDLGQFPAPTQKFTIICDSSSTKSDAFFWLPWAPGTDMVLRQACKQAHKQNNHAHNIK